MATGKSGYFDLQGSVSTFAVRINWAETYDVETNTSAVLITSIQVKSTNWTGVTYYADGLIKINGVTVISMNSTLGDSSVRPASQNEWYTVKSSGTTVTGMLSGIVHNTDGSGSITIEVMGNQYYRCAFATTSGNYNSGWGVIGSAEIALTDIPRASTIGATDSNIGSVSMIAVARKSTAYTHSIAYVFGSLSGYITASGGVSASEVRMSEASIPFKVPDSFYAQIPDEKTGVCTLTCRTYSGETQIGDAQTATFIATAGEALSAPVVTGTVVDSNAATKALTGDENKLIRYYSNALCTIFATAKNSASIARKIIGGVTVSGDTRTIAGIESGSVAFSAVDSRGYTSESVLVEKTLIPYVRLTCNPTVERNNPTDGTATLTIKGDYFNDGFGAVSNAITVKYRINSGDYVSAIPTLNGNTYACIIALSGLDYTTQHIVDVVVSDKLTSITRNLTLKRGIPVFDWGENDFRFNVPVIFDEGIDTVSVENVAITSDYAHGACMMRKLGPIYIFRAHFWNVTVAANTETQIGTLSTDVPFGTAACVLMNAAATAILGYGTIAVSDGGIYLRANVDITNARAIGNLVLTS